MQIQQERIFIIDTDSKKLKQVKAVILICQTSKQSATME